MQFGSLPGLEKPVSRLVQGTVMISSKEMDSSLHLLDAIHEMGCNCFDTANIYGGGDNEATFGHWVHSRKIRNAIVVLGKGAHPKDGKNRCDPISIGEDIEQSLGRFKFDHIDLYVLHRDDPAIPADEIIDALNHHKKKGDIGVFGGSNWTHQRLQEANDFAAKKGLQPFVVSSPQFGLAWPQKPVWEDCVTIGGPNGKEALEWYAKHPEVVLIPWSSLGGGIFSGRMTRDNLDSFTDYFDKLCADCYGHEANFRRYERAADLAKSLGLTPAQVAMAWLLHQPYDIHPLIGCRTPDEFRQNLDALDVKLTADQLEWLSEGERVGIGG